jgi:hypothetical protein
MNCCKDCIKFIAYKQTKGDFSYEYCSGSNPRANPETCKEYVKR